MSDDAELKQRISSAETDELIRMVTADREDYREEAVLYAVQELQAREVEVDSIRARGAELTARRLEHEFDKKLLSKADYYFKYKDPKREKVSKLAQEARRAPETPHRYDAAILRITPLAPEPFFTAEAAAVLERSACVLCRGARAHTRLFALVGRHLKSSHEKNRLSYIETTTQYHYQGCYVPICSDCYRKFSLWERIQGLSALVGIAGFILIPVSLAFSDAVTEVLIQIGMWMLTGFAVAFLASLFCGTGRYSRGVVETNDMMPRRGVPNTKKRSWASLATEQEMQEQKHKVE